MTPSISVCIPTLNRAPHLRGAIESVLASTLQDFEIVVSDNASDDNTEEIVQSFQDPRICYVRHKRRIPIQSNWTAALFHARSELLFKLDDDDRIEPAFLEKTVQFLKSHPEASSVYTAFLVQSPGGRPVPIVDDHFFGNRVLCDGVEYCRAILLNRNLPQNHKSAGVFRAVCAREARYFDRCLTDIIFTMAIAAQGSVGYLREPLFRYVLHGGEHEAGRVVQVADMYLKGLHNLFDLDVVKEQAAVSDLREEVLHQHRRLAPIFYTHLSFRHHGRVKGLEVARHFLREDPSLSRALLFLSSVAVLALLPRQVVHYLITYYYKAVWPKRLVNVVMKLSRSS